MSWNYGTLMFPPESRTILMPTPAPTSRSTPVTPEAPMVGNSGKNGTRTTMTVSLGSNYSGMGGEHPDFDLHRFIISHLGDPALEATHSAVVTVIYVVIFLTGVIGNFSTCLAIVHTPYLRTAPNCYVFSLAMSDVLTLIIGLPVELFMVWYGSYPWALGNGFCVFRVFALEMTSCASILTVLVFTLERFNAVCFPMHTRAQQDVPHSIVKLTFIWLISGICGIPFAYFTRTFTLEHPITKQPIEGTLICNIPRSANDYERLVLFQISTFLFFLMPLITIIIMYSMIVVAVRRSLRSIDSDMDSLPDLTVGFRSHCAPSSQLHEDLKSGNLLMKNNSDKQQMQPVFLEVHADAECAALSAAQAACHKHKKRCRKQENLQVSRRTVMRILIAVVCAFFFCWFPYHLQRLLSVYYLDGNYILGQLLTVLWYISGVLYFANGSINVVIYHLMSTKYRMALRSMCCSWFICAAKTFNPAKSQNHEMHRVHLSINNCHNHHDNHLNQGATGEEAQHEMGHLTAIGQCHAQTGGNSINHIKTTYTRVVSVVHSSPEINGRFTSQQQLHG